MQVLWIILPLLTLCQAEATTEEVDASKTEVWGPGLRPHEIILPARYFMIHANTNQGKRLTRSPGNVFSVKINGKSRSGDCHAWIQNLDRHDGSFIIRYKIFHTCTDAEIIVTYDGSHVASSPYKVTGPIYPEDCYCPTGNLSTWLKAWDCPLEHPQITTDLTPFKSVEFNSVLENALSRFNHSGSYSLCNYVVKKNQIFRKCYGQYVGFSMFVDAILLFLTRKVVLPDMEFLANLGDWPLIRQDFQPLLPIFSWCGSDDSADIVVPTYDITEASLECMGRVMLDMLSIQSSNNKPWEDKIPKAFWRGRDSRQERLDLVDIARENPDLFNVSMTNFFFFRDLEEKYGPKEKHASFFDFFDYKYQLNIDGTVAAYRFPYLLGGNAVVFKQDSPYYEHFYKQLRPWTHFIPIHRNLSDLVEKLQWAQDNDKEALKIGRNGQKFAQENLMPDDIFCYHALLLKEWSTRLEGTVNVREGMELVPQKKPDPKIGPCNCHNPTEMRKDEL